LIDCGLLIEFHAISFCFNKIAIYSPGCSGLP
jgi:hypothetical protein